jgi:hypothetical protein
LNSLPAAITGQRFAGNTYIGDTAAGRAGVERAFRLHHEALRGVRQRGFERSARQIQ